ncbi:MAG: nucleotidyltransferase domain-containing protein [Thermotogota bacterium]
MESIFKISGVLIENIKNNFKEDIALVAYYGSYATGDTHDKSDLDLFFIPKNENAFKASFQFIVEDLGIDFWPITWERFENIDSYDDHLISVLLDAKVIYSNSDEELDKFKNIQKNKLNELNKKEDNPFSKAYEKFLNNYVFLNNLKYSEDITEIRLESTKILKNTISSLSILNKIPIKKGWGKNLSEIKKFDKKINGTQEIIESIISEKNEKAIIEKMIKFVYDYDAFYKNTVKKENPIIKPKEIFQGFYEELKSTINKIIDACNENDYEMAFFSTISTIEEVAPMINLVEKKVYRNQNIPGKENINTLSELGFPNLIEIIDKDNLEILKKETIHFDNKLRNYLKEKQIEINQFENIEDLKKNLKTPD